MMQLKSVVKEAEPTVLTEDMGSGSLESDWKAPLIDG